MFYPHYIKRKALYRKSVKALEGLQMIKICNQAQDLQFEAQDEEVKKYLYKAIDELKIFIDNIDLIETVETKPLKFNKK